jgi:hypothetical protein
LYDRTIDGSYESGQVVILLVSVVADGGVVVAAAAATVEFANIIP